jgi:Family of unknown function (DUF6519)
MKGDFSRLTFDPRKRYTAVLMQQGRVQTDADWNEQAAIIEHLERTRFEDVVGPSAVPARGGFEVHAGADGAPTLSAGRMYAGGLICDLVAETPIAQVARKPLRPEPGRTDLVYLDAWERLVTALDDPDLADVALGGADTSARLQVAWTVDFVENVGDLLCADAAAALPGLGRGRLTAAAPNGYSGVENLLYRVEVHGEGPLGKATFKWSRHNGSVVLAVERFLGPSSLLLAPSAANPPRISVGDWLEIGGLELERRGLAGTLARLEDWSIESREAVFDRDVSQHAHETSVRARQWDQTQGPALPVEAGWAELEAGIQVRFDGSDFHAGDYWTIPARVASATVEWPSDAPPQGVEHRLCPLALVRWGGSRTSSYQDCRPALVPLTELYAELHRLRAEVAELKERAGTNHASGA